MSFIAAAPDDIVISLEYEPAAGVAWGDMWDNTVIGWIVDETEDIATREPTPVVIGSLPPVLSVDTSPVVSPMWIYIQGTWATVPDKWRGRLIDLFTFLATNNGATRQLRGNFSTQRVLNAWTAWATANPTLVWDGPVNLPPLQDNPEPPPPPDETEEVAPRRQRRG